MFLFETDEPDAGRVLYTGPPESPPALVLWSCTFVTLSATPLLHNNPTGDGCFDLLVCAHAGDFRLGTDVAAGVQASPTLSRCAEAATVVDRVYIDATFALSPIKSFQVKGLIGALFSKRGP